MPNNVLLGQRRLGAGASNAGAFRGANVGFGTEIPTVKMEVRGDAVVNGLITDSNMNPIVGAIVNWQSIMPAPTFGVGASGATFTYNSSACKGLFRGSGNEVVYNLNMAATVAIGANSAATDFTVPLPYAAGADYGVADAILGEMWLTVEYGGLCNVFKALARRNPGDSNTSVIRYLSGTTETRMGNLIAGTTLTLQGTLLYETTANTRLMAPTTATISSQTLTSNLAPVFGSGFTWRPAPVTPALTVPGMQAAGLSAPFAASSATGQIRYLGTDVAYQVKIAGTVQNAATASACNYQLNLPYPADIAATYPTDTIVGELWLSVINGSTSNNFKAFARTTTADANKVNLRVLSGTTEDSFSSLTVGSVITVQGTLNYETTTSYNGDILTSYVPPAFSQDFANQVVVNGSGYPPRGQLDVIGTGNAPSLVVDQWAGGANSHIAQFKSGGATMLTIGRDGLFYDSNMTATFVPGGLVQWVAGATPTIAAGTGGSLSNISGDSRYKYGGNAFIYNFTRTFTVTGTSTPGTDFTLALPYVLNSNVYPTSVKVGDVWVTVVNSSNTITTTMTGCAKTIVGDISKVAIRTLNGTAESKLTEYAVGSRITVQGLLEYASVQVSAPLASSVTSNVFYRDNYGRVSIGTDAPPRSRLDIGESNAAFPALIAESIGGGDIARFRGAPGVDEVVIDGTGNVGIGTTQPRGLFHIAGTTGTASLVVDASGNVGIGTTTITASLHAVSQSQSTPIKVEQVITGAEFPPLGASNAGYYPDYSDPVASIDTGTPLTLAEFPPVALTSATNQAAATTIAVSGAFYGNGNYIVSASSIYDANYTPWKAFDKTLADSTWISANPTYASGVPSSPSTTVSGVTRVGSWIQIQLPSSIVLKSYQITQRNFSFEYITSFVLAGSSDGSTWNTLDIQSNLTQAFWNVSTVTFNIINATSYTYFRLIITSISTSVSYANVREWKLFADIPLSTTAREYPPLPMTTNTMYLNGTYGAGMYVASESTVYTSGIQPPCLAFNKNTLGVSGDYWHSSLVYNVTNGAYTGNVNTYDISNNKYSGEWLQLYLPQPIVLSSYTIWPRLESLHTIRSPTTFWILGSLDGVRWTLLNSQSGLTWSTTPQTFNVTTSQPYSYYRIVVNVVGNSGVTSSRDSVQIAEWKLFGTQATYPKYRTAISPIQTNYNSGTYSTYANTQYNAFTADATPPLFVSDKVLLQPWRTGASNYNSGTDANPVPSVFFELPSAIRLKGYIFTAPDSDSAPSKWSLYGSNMNVVGGWQLVDSQPSVLTPWTTSLTQTYTTNASPYNFFKFDFLRNCSATSNFISLSELRLNGDDTVPESRLVVSNDGRMGINTPISALNGNSALTVSGNATVTGNISAGNLGMFRNRIINGDMRIDQRYSGTGSNVTGAMYMADRWVVSKFAAGAITAQRVVAPLNTQGFTNAMYITTTTAQANLSNSDYLTIEQRIEGYNIADFGWGTTGAQPITVSFNAMCSTAGTFSLSLRNATNSISYVTTFLLPVANQWTTVQKTIPGEAFNYWNTDNTQGLALTITLAAGSALGTSKLDTWVDSSMAPNPQGGYLLASTGTQNFLSITNNQFYLTNVQLEKGIIATPFEFRPHGVEFQLCQRYYELVLEASGSYGMSYYNTGGSATQQVFPYKVTKRAVPTVDKGSITGVNCTAVYGVYQSSLNVYCTVLSTNVFYVSISSPVCVTAEL